MKLDRRTGRLVRPTPRVLFLGKLYAGHRTRFENLRVHTECDERIQPQYRAVSGRVEGGVIERLPILQRRVSGQLRATLESSAFASMPRPDALWTSASEVLLPFLWSQYGLLRRPFVLDLDWTLAQQEALAPYYFHRPPRQGLRWVVARFRERLLWSRVSVFTPWSTWAAASLRRQGVPDSRIRVIPPGVDLKQWQPPLADRRLSDGPLRLLFVGGDFVRKGGDMLVEVFRARFAGRCELDIVSHASASIERPEPGLRFHKAEPNSPLLRELYGRADLFVLPTRADCFGIASVEAMASGLPVIMGNVGGAADIVRHGETGWLIEPTPTELAWAIEDALTARERLLAMGKRARVDTEERFDGRQNDNQVIDLLLDEIARFRRQKGRA